MDSSSSDPGMKPELGGAGSSSGGGESSEAAVVTNDQMLLYRGLKKAKKDRGCTAKERISKMPPCTIRDKFKNFIRLSNGHQSNQMERRRLREVSQHFHWNAAVSMSQFEDDQYAAVENIQD